MAPELTILIAATLMSVIDLAMGGKADRRFVAWIGMAGVVVAGLFVINYMDREPYQILADTYRLDDFANVFKLIILAGTCSSCSSPSPFSSARTSRTAASFTTCC